MSQASKVEIPDWIGQKYTYEDWPDERIIDGYKIRTPKKPPKKKIDNYYKKKENQKFEIPDQSMVWTIHEKLSNLDEEGMPIVPITDEEYAFWKQQWEYRRNGYWFFNNGYLEYITGEHWFYISYFKIKRLEAYVTNTGEISNRWGFGRPEFSDSDRDRFLLWEEVVKSNKSCGLLEITNRRDGKTYRSLSSCYNHASQFKNSNVAIQSKNFADAKKLLVRIVDAWNEMPIYFRPIDSGYSNPQSGLKFRAPNSYTKKAIRLKEEALNSVILPYPSEAVQLDGQGFAIVYNDEVGKTIEVDVAERWTITKPTLVVGATVVGKALLTSTVEEFEKGGGKQCKELWDGSDPNKLDGNGMTTTGLWRYFKPAYYGFRSGEGEDGYKYLDEYGYSNCEAAIEFQLNQLKNLTGKRLWDVQRKYPHTIEQAFRSSLSDNSFDIQSLYDQKDYNEVRKNGLYRVGRFFGEVAPGEEIKFVDDPDGPFRLSWMPDPKDQNRRWPQRGISLPANDRLGLLGIDSFDNKETVDNRNSLGAITGQFDFNALDPIFSTGVFLQYLHRPASPYQFYKDVQQACIFLGMQALIENNKPGLLNEMERVGTDGYCMMTDRAITTVNGSHKGILGMSTSGKYVREQMMNELAEHIFRFVGYISEQTQTEILGIPKEKVEGPQAGYMPFNDVLDQAIEFKSGDWEKYDAMVSWMLANFGLKYRKRKEQKSSTDLELHSWKQLFSNLNLS